MLHTKLSWAMGVLAVSVLALAIMVLVADTLTARAAIRPAPTVVAEETDQQRREVQTDGTSPTISFIDSPGATCYRANVGTCYLQWSYLSVSASSSQYIISMTLSINGQVRAYSSGFFQTAMYIPSDMFKHGFKVACGTVSGPQGLGYSYDYVIRAVETGGLGAANYGTITCPADVGTIFIPIVVKR